MLSDITGSHPELKGVTAAGATGKMTMTRDHTGLTISLVFTKGNRRETRRDCVREHGRQGCTIRGGR